MQTKYDLKYIYRTFKKVFRSSKTLLCTLAYQNKMNKNTARRRVDFIDKELLSGAQLSPWAMNQTILLHLLKHTYFSKSENTPFPFLPLTLF